MWWSGGDSSGECGVAGASGTITGRSMWGGGNNPTVLAVVAVVAVVL